VGFVPNEYLDSIKKKHVKNIVCNSEFDVDRDLLKAIFIFQLRK